MCGNDIKAATGIDINAPTASAPSIEGVLNAATNYLTLGALGYKDGKLDKGVITHAADEAIGEVSGRNAARKQIMEGKDAANQLAIDKAQQLKDEQLRKQQQDVNASQTAGALRASAAAQQAGYLGSATGKLTQDFLGL